MSDTTTTESKRRPVIEQVHGNWELLIHDDQPIQDGKQYPAESRVQLLNGGDLVREFLYPAYRIWTLLAHWTDGLDAEETKP